jgi:hypothetical protein
MIIAITSEENRGLTPQERSTLTRYADELDGTLN